jgi:hypothetical protein
VNTNGMTTEPEVLKLCEVCTGPIYRRKYQSDEVRVCGPTCAASLAHREHPEDFPGVRTGATNNWCAWCGQKKPCNTTGCPGGRNGGMTGNSGVTGGGR